ncbi:MAG TPA: hypothetical protein VHI13_11100 [Candidatus Kapabacteria bacterium]|nr:hypothetical protein [Candidatus Kapabacteria bacterium]
MEQIFKDIYLVFPANSTERGRRYTYLIRRPRGNFLLENLDATPVGDRFDQIEQLGGIAAHFINDRHNVSTQSAVIGEHFEAPFYCSSVEARVITVDVPMLTPLPYERQWVDDDFEVIPIPGHTRGAFAYLWHTPARQFLFIGDTLVPVDGGWKVWVPKPSIGLMIESLEMLKQIDFDVLIGNSFASTVFPCFEWTSREKRSVLDGVIRDLSSSV